MRTHAVKIGYKYRHNNRGSEYTIIGLVCSYYRDWKDHESAWFTCTESVDGYDVDCSLSKNPLGMMEILRFSINITMQISYDYHSTKDRNLLGGPMVIYIGTDNKIWGRPLPEFTSDRFTRIKP